MKLKKIDLRYGLLEFNNRNISLNKKDIMKLRKDKYNKGIMSL